MTTANMTPAQSINILQNPREWGADETIDAILALLGADTEEKAEAAKVFWDPRHKMLVLNRKVLAEVITVIRAHDHADK